MLYSLIISLSVMMLLFGLGYVAAHTVIPQETVGEEVTGDGLPVTGEEKYYATAEETFYRVFKELTGMTPLVFRKIQ